jgi:DNA-binding IscR family transcriptional regulator
MIMFIMNRSDRYRLEALMELARSYPEGRSAAQIAARRGIPTAYLSRLLAELGRAGWVRSRRGPGGGVKLAHPPETISVGSVFRPSSTDPSLPTALGRLADMIDRAVRESITTISVADLAGWEDRTATPDYSI